MWRIYGHKTFIVHFITFNCQHIQEGDLTTTTFYVNLCSICRVMGGRTRCAIIRKIIVWLDGLFIIGDKHFCMFGFFSWHSLYLLFIQLTAHMQNKCLLCDSYTNMNSSTVIYIRKIPKSKHITRRQRGEVSHLLNESSCYWPPFRCQRQLNHAFSSMRRLWSCTINTNHQNWARLRIERIALRPECIQMWLSSQICSIFSVTKFGSHLCPFHFRSTRIKHDGDHYCIMIIKIHSH